MKFIRKSLGIFIIVFVAMPLLFGVIWGVGVIKATTSPYFLSELPREIIDRLPGAIKEAAEIVRNSDGDAEMKKWFAASDRAGVNWENVIKDSGILDWVNIELKEKIGRLGVMFDGEDRLKNITLNLKPLKHSLKHDVIYDSIKRVLENLPEGSGSETAMWDKYISGEGNTLVPMVRPPDVEQVIAAIKAEMFYEIDDMQDYVKLVNVSEFGLYGHELTKFFNDISFLMFLLPVVLIILGSLAGGYGLKGFLKWCGISTLSGGIVTFVSVKVVQGLVTLSSWLPAHANIEINETFIRVGSVMFGKIEELFSLVTDALFDPVSQVAKVVCLVGIVVWAISFTVADNNKESKKLNA